MDGENIDCNDTFQTFLRFLTNTNTEEMVNRKIYDPLTNDNMTKEYSSTQRPYKYGSSHK